MKLFGSLVLILFSISINYGSVAAFASSHDGANKIQLPAVNPHGDDGDCSVCHVSSADSLKSWFTFEATKRQLIGDPVKLCQKCHGVSFGHGVGKKTALNRAELPLSSTGTITCALTCHNMHIKGATDAKQQRFHLRLPISKLCVSCHNK